MTCHCRTITSLVFEVEMEIASFCRAAMTGHCPTKANDCNSTKSDCNFTKSDCYFTKSDCYFTKSDCYFTKSDCLSWSCSRFL